MDPPRVCPFSKDSILDFTTGVETSMSIWYHDKKHRLHKVSENTAQFLADDLDVSRLDRLQKPFIGLRLVGRYKAVARPLHRQLIMDRQIIVTEQADLHLIWDHARLYIKPLSAYLFDQRIWVKYLCRSPSLYASACGLFLLYVWLIIHESDFRLAVGNEIPLLLFRENLTWTTWRKLVENFSGTINVRNRETVSPRYTYGELRIDRLNQLYRFFPTILFSQNHALIRGYHYRYHKYSSFLKQNFLWLIVVFAYVTIVLSAMQVGLSTTRLSSSPAFQHVAYGFAVFAIALSVALVGFVIALSMLLAISNVLATVRNWSRHNKNPRIFKATSLG